QKAKKAKGRKPSDWRLGEFNLSLESGWNFCDPPRRGSRGEQSSRYGREARDRAARSSGVEVLDPPLSRRRSFRKGAHASQEGIGGVRGHADHFGAEAEAPKKRQLLALGFLLPSAFCLLPSATAEPQPRAT